MKWVLTVGALAALALASVAHGAAGVSIRGDNTVGKTLTLSGAPDGARVQWSSSARQARGYRTVGRRPTLHVTEGMAGRWIKGCARIAGERTCSAPVMITPFVKRLERPISRYMGSNGEIRALSQLIASRVIFIRGERQVTYEWESAPSKDGPWTSTGDRKKFFAPPASLNGKYVRVVVAVANRGGGTSIASAGAGPVIADPYMTTSPTLTLRTNAERTALFASATPVQGDYLERGVRYEVIVSNTGTFVRVPITPGTDTPISAEYGGAYIRVCASVPSPFAYTPTRCSVRTRAPGTRVGTLQVVSSTGAYTVGATLTAISPWRARSVTTRLYREVTPGNWTSAGIISATNSVTILERWRGQRLKAVSSATVAYDANGSSIRDEVEIIAGPVT